MAILTTIGQGESKFYEVPDDQLSQYELKTEQRKDDTSGETPEGKMPAALMNRGSDVQAYSGDICWIRNRRTGVIYWWYC
jgi:hypothetical protein